jgi:hypothetical protein
MVGEIISFPNLGSLEKETVKESGVLNNQLKIKSFAIKKREKMLSLKESIFRRIEGNASAFKKGDMMEPMKNVVDKMVTRGNVKILNNIDYLTREIVKDWMLLSVKGLRHIDPNISGGSREVTLWQWTNNNEKLELIVYDEPCFYF